MKNVMDCYIDFNDTKLNNTSADSRVVTMNSSPKNIYIKKSNSLVIFNMILDYKDYLLLCRGI